VRPAALARTPVCPRSRAALAVALVLALTLTAGCVAPRRTPAGELSSTGGRQVYGTETASHDAGSPWPAPPTAREALLTGDGSQLLVEARLNGRVSGTFLVDTGASYCVITPAVARQLGFGLGRGLTKEGAQPLGAVTLATPTGDIEAPITTLRVVEVANARAGDVSTVIYPAVEEPLSGILGLSFLNHFEFSVDSRRRILRLRPF
jgi:clan AA aspartic protease (TIGR02281 family)